MIAQEPCLGASCIGCGIDCFKGLRGGTNTHHDAHEKRISPRESRKYHECNNTTMRRGWAQDGVKGSPALSCAKSLRERLRFGPSPALKIIRGCTNKTYRT